MSRDTFKAKGEKCHYCDAGAEICDYHRRGFMVCAECYDKQIKEVEDE